MCQPDRIYLDALWTRSEFDLIVLSEVWSNNIEFYQDIFKGYTLYFDLPTTGNVGRIGIFTRNDILSKFMPQYYVENTDKNQIG